MREKNCSYFFVSPSISNSVIYEGLNSTSDTKEERKLYQLKSLFNHGPRDCQWTTGEKLQAQAKYSLALSKAVAACQTMRNHYMAKRSANGQVSDRQKAGSCQNLLHLCVDLLAFNICSLAWRKCVTRSSWQPHLERKGVLRCRIWGRHTHSLLTNCRG